jgi:hypothetical protein
VRASIERRYESEMADAAYWEGDEEAQKEARDGILYLSLARDAVCEYETGDWAEHGAEYCETYGVELSGRVPTVTGIGVMVPSSFERPHREATVERFFTDIPADELSRWVEAALAACRQGQPAEALALGHDLHWLSAGDARREEWALALLESAYSVLDRPALAAIARAHQQRRDLPNVDVYG